MHSVPGLLFRKSIILLLEKRFKKEKGEGRAIVLYYYVMTNWSVTQTPAQ